MWDGIATNYTGIVDSLYFIDAYGNYFSGFYGNGGVVSELCNGFQPDTYDPRVNLVSSNLLQLLPVRSYDRIKNMIETPYYI